jgi:hypothetical protein
MPTLANIVLTDNSAVDHTYVPTGRSGPDLTEFAAAGGDTPISDETLSISFSRATNQRPTDRTQARLGQPLEYTDADGQEVVDDTFRAELKVIAPRSTTTAQRDEFLSLIEAFVASDEFRSYVVLRSPFYG